MKKFFVIMFVVLSTGVGLSQSIDFGVGIGSSVYWGDLNTPEFFDNLQNNGGISGQVFARYRATPNFGGRANLIFGSFKGNDANSSLDWQNARNLKFKSNIVELSLTGEYYVLPNFFNDEFFFTPYLTAGAGFIYFDPRTELNGVTYKLQDIGTEGQGQPGFDDKYSKVASSLAYGGGAIIRLSSSLDLNLEVVGRWSNTDYLDDLSGSYVSREEFLLAGNTIGAALGDRTPEVSGMPSDRVTGSQRGGELVQDYYYTFMASVVFEFGGGGLNGKRRGGYNGECPTF